jgi:hypothetical protein
VHVTLSQRLCKSNSSTQAARHAVTPLPCMQGCFVPIDEQQQPLAGYLSTLQGLMANNGCKVSSPS